MSARDAGTICADADEVEVRSLLASCAVTGEDFFAADHGDRTRTQVLERAAGLLVDIPSRCARGAGACEA